MPPLKSVLITGCSDGVIGSALATTFHERGYHVFATARNVSKMSALADLQNTTLLVLDVGNSEQTSAAVEAVKKETGGTLDILINNAGRNHFSPVLDIDIAAAKNVYETNLWGPLAMIQAFVPLVIKAKGTIVSVTSISGYVNLPHMGLYAASKRSLEILTEHLRVEVEPFGVRVLSVVTGAVKSKGQTYFEDWSLPEDSIYKPIEELVHQRANGIDEAKREPTMWWKISSAALPEKFGGVVERGRSSLDPRFCHRRSWIGVFPKVPALTNSHKVTAEELLIRAPS